MSSPISRRSFLVQASAATVGAIGVLGAMSACQSGGGAGSNPTCNDADGVTISIQQQRTQLQYVSVATDPARRCDGCALYTSPAAGSACGGCSALRGPIAPGASCIAFAPRPA